MRSRTGQSFWATRTSPRSPLTGCSARSTLHDWPRRSTLTGRSHSNLMDVSLRLMTAEQVTCV